MEAESRYYAPYVDQTNVTILAANQKEPFIYQDCRENVLRNLFNNILYDPDLDRFQIDLLYTIRKISQNNGSTSLIDKIIEFYLIYDSPSKQGIYCTPKDKSSSSVTVKESELVLSATEWANLLSGLRGVTYWWPTGRIRRPFTLGDTHEINAGIGNYLRVFAHIFGLVSEDTECCPILRFESLEDLFREAGVHISFQKNSKVPIPEADLSKPATLRDVRFDNHDIERGKYDHPRAGVSNRYDYIQPIYLQPPPKEFVEEKMMEALSEFPLLESED